MPPRSPLSIATSSLERLVKEIGSYHKELEQQQARITKLENGGGDVDDENAEYVLRQEKRALEETRAVFPSLRDKIRDSTDKLNQRLEQDKQNDQIPPAEIQKATEVIANAQQILQESS